MSAPTPGTPLPWLIATTSNSYNEDRTSWREIIAEGDEGEEDTVIAEVYCRIDDDQPQPDDATAALNAAYIEVACNSFPELVAALEASLAALNELAERASGFSVSGVYFDEPCMTAEVAALAKAYDAIEQGDKALSALEVGGGNRG